MNMHVKVVQKRRLEIYQLYMDLEILFDICSHLRYKPNSDSF